MLIKVNIMDPDPNHLKKSDPECGSWMHDPELRVHILYFFYKLISPWQSLGQHTQ
jgi:hypothetical protein